MAFRKGEPLKKDEEERNPLVLQGPAEQVTSRQIRTRAVRGEHIAPGVIQERHLAENLKQEVHAHTGSVTQITNSNGTIVVTHGLPFTPSAVVTQPEAPRDGSPIFGQTIVDQIGSESFRIRCFAVDGTALDSVTVTFRWVAFR